MGFALRNTTAAKPRDFKVILKNKTQQRRKMCQFILNIKKVFNKFMVINPKRLRGPTYFNHNKVMSR